VNTSVAALLRAHDLHPRKGLGQNFLADPVALARIVAAADLSPQDCVVEVGAGLGSLTRLLAERAGLVAAIELDSRLVAILRDQLADLPNVQIVQGDVLEIVDLGFPDYGYKVVANLPYYITSAVLRHFLEGQARPQRMVVTVQLEVARRLVAVPGDMSLLAVSVQFYGHPEIIARIPAGAFYPRPKVDSAVVRIEVSQAPTVALPKEVSVGQFFRVVRAGFSQRRKTLRNSLSAGLHLPPARVAEAVVAAAIDPRRRAETLSLEDWAQVARRLAIRAAAPDVQGLVPRESESE
jgi:16S rRNA (adenine1518-N6/adenine1519-N6)-dimethyltransferase